MYGKNPLIIITNNNEEIDNIQMDVFVMLFHISRYFKNNICTIFW